LYFSTWLWFLGLAVVSHAGPRLLDSRAPQGLPLAPCTLPLDFAPVRGYSCRGIRRRQRFWRNLLSWVVVVNVSPLNVAHLYYRPVP